MTIWASINGEILPAAEARVPVLDNGLMFGDSVYETLRTYGRRPFHLDRHLVRLRASATRLGIGLPLTDAELGGRMADLLERSGHPDESYVRILLTRGVGDVSYHFERVKGPTLIMITKPYEPLPERLYADGIPVVIVSVRRNHPTALDPAIKSGNLLNNIQAAREGQARGAFEPILLNAAGDVAEGAGSNVFLVEGGSLRTPPLDAGILEGVTRGVVMQLAGDLGIPLRQDRVAPGELREADEAFITSTLKEVAPISTIDGQSLGALRPVTSRLLQAYRDYARAWR